jgi:hypothetical protein
MVGLVLADALLERFGGDSMTDLRSRVTATGHRIRGRVSRPNPTTQITRGGDPGRPAPAQA